MTPTAPSRLPYPGLRSFRREESDLFFGREDCINTMVDRLAATRFLAVLGSSGTGKSSVVKTGLLDALDLGLMAAAGSAWRVVDFRPGGAPLKNLSRRLLETETDGSEAGANVSEADVELLRAFLVRGPRSIAEWCGDGHLPEPFNLLLLVDQFEELFRYQDYAGREEAEAFAGLLVESARPARSPIYVALTMRSEYLGACALIEGLAEAISAGMFLIPRMTREQCRTAIVGPATVCGFEIEEALANRLLNDLAAFAPWDDRGTRDQLDRLGRRADQLPLLQYSLNRMWVRARDGAGSASIALTLADYERIGGLGGALNAHANEILGTLGDDRRSVAEAIFRALTEGSTVAEAVRRPTRFGELVEICNGDEAAVRAVVDAFRAPGCNFLAPELDPKNPKPVAAATIIDISHESLIRQWKQLSEWLEVEARAVRLWRRLTDRFEDGEPMHGPELAQMLAWRDEEKPNAAWARRYGGDFPAIIKFIETSERRRRRFAPVVLPLFSLAVLFISAVFLAGIWSLVSNEPKTHWSLDLAVVLGSTAITCAFGLWRYAGLGLGRALLAAATIFVLAFAAGAGSITVLMSHGITEQSASYWWNATLAAPCIVTAMAIFAPSFRRLPVWMLLVVTYAVAVAVANDWLSANPMGALLLYLAGWCLCCAVFGSQLRRPGDLGENVEHRRGLAAFKLGLLFFAIIYMNAIWTGAVLTVVFGSTPQAWSRLIDIGSYSAALAITFSVGLQRYRRLRPGSAMLAGLTIFTLEYAPGVAFMGTLLSHNVPLVQASHWVGGILVAPCALVGLAVFDGTFRRVSEWLLFAALFAGTYAGLVWLYDNALISINLPTLNFLIASIGALCIAAIAYRLQPAPHEAGSASGLRADTNGAMDQGPEPRKAWQEHALLAGCALGVVLVGSVGVWMLQSAIVVVSLSPERERALTPKDVFKDCANCPEMVVVPAGSFAMGSPANEARREDNEGPQHGVTFARPFAVGKFAVTFDEWDACVADGGCGGYRPGDQGWGRGRRPVINVSWDDAKEYVAWLSRKTRKTYRLLSEAEREYVTRAGTTSPFWWGSSISTSQANYDGDYAYGDGTKGEYRRETVPVDSFQPNPWGFYQVHGNLYDWVEDCWHNSYDGAPSDGSTWTSGDCKSRVLRGGSWNANPRYLRAANRHSNTTGLRGNALGFRVGRTLTP